MGRINRLRSSCGSPVGTAIIAFALAACARNAPMAPVVIAPSLSPRELSVYRAIAESVYVHTTGRVVAVAATSLDTACAREPCGDLASRWGVETLWWAKGDSTEAREARADLLGHASSSLDMRSVTRGRAMLLDTDAGDIPPSDADITEWLRFRATHADASGAVRMSPIGFSGSGRTAVAFVDWHCGPTCGHTVAVALTATSDSTWSIADMLLTSSLGK